MNCTSCGMANAAEANFCMICGAGMASQALPELTDLPETPASSGFIGRLRELNELKAFLADILAGQGRLVLLAGEPGIGKTRIAQELASLSDAQGVRVLWGRCYEGEGAPPYWPWVQPLRTYVQQLDPERLRTELGSGAADIAQMVSDVQDRLPDLTPPPDLEPEQARFRLFDSITNFLKNASQTQPMMLVLDDLHWADQSSLLLLEFICAEIQPMPLLIVGTYRDVEIFRGQPLSETLGNLIRQPRFSRVLLQGLTQLEVEQLLQAGEEFSLPSNLLDTIYRRTEGNPLFVNEVTRMLVREQNMGDPELLSTIPQGVKETIGRRLSRLSPDCSQALTIASVIGREFDFQVLKALMADVAEDELLAAIDEGLQARMIDELLGASEGYQFSHALIQETFFSELSNSRRVRLHARIAETLEELYGSEVEIHAPELAYHFAEAESVLGVDKLVQYSLLSGQQALASYAYEEAATLFNRGLTARKLALDGRSALPDRQAADLVFGLGRAQIATLQRHQRGEAVDNLERAFDYYADAGELLPAVAAATYPLPYTPGRYSVAPMVSRALTLVQPDSHDAGRLLAAHTRVLGVEKGDYDGALGASRQAIDIARREKDQALEVRTLIETAYVNAYHVRLREVLDNSLQVIELGRSWLDQYAEAAAHFLAAGASYALGETEGAQRHAAASIEPAEKTHDLTRLNSVIWMNSLVAHALGDWSTAQKFTDWGMATSQDPRCVLSRVLTEGELGNLREGQIYLERALEIIKLTPPGPTLEHALQSSSLALINHLRGVGQHLEMAETSARAVLADPSGPPMYKIHAHIALGLMAAQRGDGPTAAEHYDALLPQTGTMPIAGATVADRVLGILSHATGDLDRAGAHFEDALAFCRRAGFHPELAWTGCDYADTLLQRNGSGDVEKTRSLLDQSLSISTELGMRPLRERVQARLEQLDSSPTPMPAYPDGLSDREVQVLRLIATGKSNPEIGEELVISVRTVANHVANILNKTNTINRTEAAAYATRHGLT